MEDAAIHQLDIGDGNALFAVFDGHGGNSILIQALRSASMLLTFLSKCSSHSQNMLKRIM